MTLRVGYRFQCGECYQQMTVHFDSIQGCIDFARIDGWKIDEPKHLCPDCVKHSCPDCVEKL